jgi:hypothetical protein
VRTGNPDAHHTQRKEETPLKRITLALAAFWAALKSAATVAFVGDKHGLLVSDLPKQYANRQKQAGNPLSK